MRANGNRFGTHRVIEPAGVMPQAAWKLDNSLGNSTGNSMEIYDNEVLIDVETLNIDAASFTQLEKEAGGDPARIAARIAAIVADRGKMHNPVTGSGGMLIGTVREVGPAYTPRLLPGDRIATLVSLSLTPLRLERVNRIHLETDQVDVTAQAILFESGIFARLPADLPDKLALAVLDVAGAPAQTAKLVRPGDTVLVLGAGGKSGLLCLYEARKRAGVTGRVIGLASSQSSYQRVLDSGLADIAVRADATRPLEVYDKIDEVTGGRMADLTINCVNVAGTEMASIMATRRHGTVYFFTMATSFTAAALGAEGIGHDVTMIIGNGYTEGHDAITLQLMREAPALRRLFETLFVR
jgi:L-erythro-3,5-diaminohexanoate dehydrogenase